MGLLYIRRGKPWAVVLGYHNESELYPWAPFRSLELTVYARKDGRIGKRHDHVRGRFWLTWLLSPGMSELHFGYDKRKRL